MKEDLKADIDIKDLPGLSAERVKEAKKRWVYASYVYVYVRENHFEYFFILRMTVLGHGLIFQQVLLACTYNKRESECLCVCACVCVCV